MNKLPKEEMNVLFVSLTILYFARVQGLPIHSGRFQHVIHNHDHDKRFKGHQSHQATPLTWKNSRRRDNEFDRNAIYEVPSNRHFNDNRKISIKRLTTKSFFNKHNFRRPKKTNLQLKASSTENRKKNKIFSKIHTNPSTSSSRQIYRHIQKLKTNRQQKIVTLPETLQKSLSLGTYDHDFGITKRGVAEAELLQSKQTMTPHLPRRYIENLLKLNIWNTNDTIKVNPTSTELGRNWNLPKMETNMHFHEQMIASEFSTEGTKRKLPNIAKPKPTKSTFKKLSIQKATPIKTSPTPLRANRMKTSENKMNFKNKTNIIHKTGKKHNLHPNIENNLKRKHNVSRSDVIQLQGIHIMFSSMKQNLSKIIPTLHLTASISNSSEGKSNHTTITQRTSGKRNLNHSFETLIGTAVIKNGHLYLVVYPFGSLKNSSLKYHNGKNVTLSTEEIIVDTKSPIALKTVGGLKSGLKDENSLQTTTKLPSSPELEPIQKTMKQTSSEKVSIETLDSKLADFHANVHNKHGSHNGHTTHSLHGGLHRGMSHHSHNIHHGHMQHSGHASRGSTVQTGDLSKEIERFMSPWKQMNLSSVLPYLKMNRTKDKSTSEEDDSAYKMVSFIAEATDPFYKVKEIIGTIKNTTNNATTSDEPTTNTPIDPAVDGTFNFELKLEGSDALSLSEMISTEKISTEVPKETTTLSTITFTDSKVQNSESNIVTSGIITSTTEPLKSTKLPGTIEMPHSTPKSASQEPLIPLHIYPSMFFVSKENDLYETIDSVIMQKLKAENSSTPKPTVQIGTSPNVTLEALGIKKESLPKEGKQVTPDTTTVKITTSQAPSTTQTFTTETSVHTLPPSTETGSTVQISTGSLESNHYQTITSSINDVKHHHSSYFTNYDNTIHTSDHASGHGQPVITLSDVLHNIRRIQFQNSARFNLQNNNNLNTMNLDNGHKVSSSKDPVVLEGPIYQDFVTNSYAKSTNNEQSLQVTSPSSNSYKSWSHHAVRQALGAMLVLSVDDILADHTTLHGTIVMAQNKDQNKDQSKEKNKDQSKDKNKDQSKDKNKDQSKDKNKDQSKEQSKDQSKDSSSNNNN